MHMKNAIKTWNEPFNFKFRPYDDEWGFFFINVTIFLIYSLLGLTKHQWKYPRKVEKVSKTLRNWGDFQQPLSAKILKGTCAIFYS